MMPFHVARHPEPTALLGDVDAFMAYVDSGQAAREYDAILARHTREWAAMEWQQGAAWGNHITAWQRLDGEQVLG